MLLVKFGMIQQKSSERAGKELVFLMELFTHQAMFHIVFGQEVNLEVKIFPVMSKQIFSKQNIAKHPQQDIEISFSREDRQWTNFLSISQVPVDQNTAVFRYYLERSGDRRNTIGTLIWTNRGLNHQPQIEDDVLTSDSDDDTPVGSCGRISTADGRILSDPNIILELQRMEHERSQEQLRRAERAAQRAARSTTLMSYQFDCCFANFLFLKGLTGL